MSTAVVGVKCSGWRMYLTRGFRLETVRLIVSLVQFRMLPHACRLSRALLTFSFPTR